MLYHFKLYAHLSYTSPTSIVKHHLRNLIVLQLHLLHTVLPTQKHVPLPLLSLIMQQLGSTLHEVTSQLVAPHFQTQLLIPKEEVVIVILGARFPLLQRENTHFSISHIEKKSLRAAFLGMKGKSSRGEGPNYVLIFCETDEENVLLAIYQSMEVVTLLQIEVVETVEASHCLASLFSDGAQQLG